MPYLNSRKFVKYIESARVYLKLIQSINPPIKLKYPKMNKEKEMDIGWSIRSHINRKNEINQNRYKYLQEEAKKCEKNLEATIKSSKENIFGLKYYKKIPTSNWGKVNMKDFVNYLQRGIEISKELYKELNSDHALD